MSVATTRPPGPARRAAATVCPPAPAATSSTRLPGATPAASSIRVGGRAEPGLQRRSPAVPGLGGVLPLLRGWWSCTAPGRSSRRPPRGSGAPICEGARPAGRAGRSDLALRQIAGRRARRQFGRGCTGAGGADGRDGRRQQADLRRMVGPGPGPVADHRAGRRRGRHRARPPCCATWSRPRRRTGVRTAWGTCVDGAARLLAVDPGAGPAGPRRRREPGAGRIGDDAALLAPVVPVARTPPAGQRSRGIAPAAGPRRRRRGCSTRWPPPARCWWCWTTCSGPTSPRSRCSTSWPGLPTAARVGLVGAYRRDELPPATARRLADLLAAHRAPPGRRARRGRRRPLVERVAGRTGADAAAVHRRTGGHPFFVRELALLARGRGPGRAAAGRGPGRDRPAARNAAGADRRRPGRGGGGRSGAAARRARRGAGTGRWTSALAAAVAAGMVVARRRAVRFPHDLLRETLLDRLPPRRRTALHRDLGAALAQRGPAARTGRRGRGGPPLRRRDRPATGPTARCTGRCAAAADSAALAFGEAAGHLRRLRAAVAAARGAGRRPAPGRRAARRGRRAGPGRAPGRRPRAAPARHRPGRPGRRPGAHRPGGAGRPAQLGARFAARRDEVVAELDRALAAVAGVDPRWEAQADRHAGPGAAALGRRGPAPGPAAQRARAGGGPAGRRPGHPAGLPAGPARRAVDARHRRPARVGRPGDRRGRPGRRRPGGAGGRAGAAGDRAAGAGVAGLRGGAGVGRADPGQPRPAAPAATWPRPAAAAWRCCAAGSPTGSG